MYRMSQTSYSLCIEYKQTACTVLVQNKKISHYPKLTKSNNAFNAKYPINWCLLSQIVDNGQWWYTSPKLPIKWCILYEKGTQQK